MASLFRRSYRAVRRATKKQAHRTMRGIRKRYLRKTYGTYWR